MADFVTGKVTEIIEERDDLVRVRVSHPNGETDAAGFPSMCGPLAPGDQVVLNVTGLELALGTGGVGFVLWNLSGEGPADSGEGHIVKLRYTPWQMNVLVAEAPESPHHDALRDRRSVDGLPVVAASLHSQIAGIAAGAKAARPEARVGYVMTDGAALPIAWSRLVAELRAAGLIDVTCTAGHAFGGDHESVNVYSALAVLRWVEDVDVAIVAMGPGIVGTGTALGFTGVEQAHVLDATEALGGRAIACLRVSFADERERHHGLSHHTETVLALARSRATIVVPELAGREIELHDELDAAGLSARHSIVTLDGSAGVELLTQKGIAPTSMGRRFEDISELFLAAAAAGAHAAAPGR
jgi:hypothetical protein